MSRFLATTALFLSGCVIIIRPTDGNGPPVPVPLTCQTTGAPTAHVLFSTRLERSTINLADRTAALMQQTVLGLAGAGVQVTTVTLGRAGEDLSTYELLAAWGCNGDSPESLPPADVIRFYASQSDPGPARHCALTPLADMGLRMSEVVTQYPPGLSGTSSLRVFGTAPDFTLVVHLDHLARQLSAEDPACEEAMTTLSGDWPRYANSSAPRVGHWIITTAEKVERAAFVRECRDQEGFPADALDVLEPSPLALYGPMQGRIANSAALSYCQMLGQPIDFVVKQSAEIGRDLGLDPNEDRIREIVTSGALPATEGEVPNVEPGG